MAIAGGIDVTNATVGLPATVTDFPGPFAAPVLAALGNPNRVFLLVLFSTPTGIISPAPGHQVMGFGPDVGGVPGGRLLHRASMPGLLQGEWFVYDPMNGTIRVYDVELDR